MLGVRNFGSRMVQFAILAGLLAIPLAVAGQVTGPSRRGGQGRASGAWPEAFAFD